MFLLEGGFEAVILLFSFSCDCTLLDPSYGACSDTDFAMRGREREIREKNIISTTICVVETGDHPLVFRHALTVLEQKCLSPPKISFRFSFLVHSQMLFRTFILI